MFKRARIMPSRGALIVLEGCDRSGKTTQCSLLQKNLSEQGIKVMTLKFPDRTTAIGKMIDGYLTRKTEVEDHAVHLLFSANRWEQLDTITDLLNQGTSLIVDRYAFSGVAFTASKPGFDMGWCKQPDIGLPRPDRVLYLTLRDEAAAKRAGFGEERYEQTDMQARVADNFKKLKDDSYWQMVDAEKSVEALQQELVQICKTVIEEAKDKPLSKLWSDEPMVSTTEDSKPKEKGALKVYFAGSISGGRGDAHIYFEIVNFMKREKGYTVLSEHVGYKDVEKFEEGQSPKDIYTRDVKWLDECDLVVAEVTIPSTGVGYEISRAVDKKKRVICLYRGKTSTMLVGADDAGESLVTVRYEDVSEMEGIFDRFDKRSGEFYKFV